LKDTVVNFDERDDQQVARLRENCRESVVATLKAIDDALPVSPDLSASPSSMLFLGELKTLGGRPDEAIKIIRKAIAAGGTEHWYYKSLGWTLSAAGKDSEAREAFATALADTPVEAADLDHLVAAYYLDRIDADEFIRLATGKGAQGESFARFYVGQRLWWDGDQKAARDQFQKAVEAAKKNNASGIVINFAGACLKNMPAEP
jgi:tetratricopeptide (TPR) repeat protein